MSQKINTRLGSIETLTMETLTTTRAIQQALEDHIFKTQAKDKEGHGQCSKLGEGFTKIGDDRRANMLAEDITPTTGLTKSKFPNLNIEVSDSSEDHPNVRSVGTIKQGKAGELNFRKRAAGKTVGITDPYFSDVEHFDGGKVWTNNQPKGTETGRRFDKVVHCYYNLFINQHYM